MQNMGNAIFCDPAMLEKVDTVAHRYHISREQVVQAALAIFFEKEKDMQGYIAETKVSWEHYQQTGLHATEEEVFAWLETWGTDHEQGMPECHT